MAETRLTVQHQAGLHARPAALFVRTAAGFEASIRVRNLTRGDDREVDAKSIVGMMTLGVEQGHEILIIAEGSDDNQAIAALRGLIDGNFGEPAR